MQPVGISRDSPWTHIAWTQTLDLNFGLLSDYNGDATRALGIGIDFRGFDNVSGRSAFLVGGDGVIRGAWAYDTSDLPDVDELLVAARELTSGSSGPA